MEIKIELPDPIAKQLVGPEDDIPRRVLEAVALEGYRSGRLSRGEVRELLGLTYWETEEFLAKHGAYRHYSLADLELDRKALEGLDLR